MNLRWTSYVAPKPPDGLHKRKTAVFRLKLHFTWRKSDYKVSLCEYCQRQSWRAFTGLPVTFGQNWPTQQSHGLCDSWASFIFCLHCQFEQNTGWPKNGTVFWYALTSSNINRFSIFFHYQNQKKTCNNNITKDPTTFSSVSLHYLVKCQVS